MDDSAKKDPIRDNSSWYLRQLSQKGPLSGQREKELAQAIQKGDLDALDLLVESNLRFVVAFCKRYSGLGVPLSDLAGEGCLGLVQAAKRFDPQKNVKFITYAVWWVRQAVVRAIATQKHVFHMSQRDALLLNRLKKSIRTMTQELKQRPTIQELSKIHALPVAKVRQLLTFESKLSTTPLNIDDEKKHPTLATSPQDVVETNLMRESLVSRVRTLLQALNKREQLVLKLRFGFLSGVTLTLAHVSEVLNLSRERVRQIEKNALGKLRQQRSIETLRCFLR